MVFLFVASHSTDLVLPCKKDTLCFIENVSFSVPLKINDLGFDIIERGAAMIPTEDIIPTVKTQSLHQLNVTLIADTLVGAAVIIFVKLVD